MRNMLYEAAWNADTNLGGDVDAGQAAMCKYFLRQRFLRGR